MLSIAIVGVLSREDTVKNAMTLIFVQEGNKIFLWNRSQILAHPRVWFSDSNLVAFNVRGYQHVAGVAWALTSG